MQQDDGGDADPVAMAERAASSLLGLHAVFKSSTSCGGDSMDLLRAVLAADRLPFDGSMMGGVDHRRSQKIVPALRELAPSPRHDQTLRHLTDLPLLHTCPWPTRTPRSSIHRPMLWPYILMAGQCVAYLLMCCSERNFHWVAKSQPRESTSSPIQARMNSMSHP